MPAPWRLRIVPDSGWWSPLAVRDDPVTLRRVFADVMIWTSQQKPD